MKLSPSRFSLIATLALCWAMIPSIIRAEGNDSDIVASFLKQVAASKQIAADAKTQIEDAVKSAGPTSADAITEGLLIAYPNYADAIEASDDDNLNEAIESLTPLAQSDDLYLAADASFYLARTLMNAERFEEAIPLLEKLTGKLKDYTLHRGTAQYYMGVAQAGMLQNKKAIQSFIKFLDDNPNAPERLRVSAYRQAQQLYAIKQGQLSDIHHRMDYSRRRLELKETGDATQEEQEKIVKMLGKLIKQQQKKEANSSCKSGKKKNQPAKPSAPKPNETPKPNKGQKGGQSANPNGVAQKKIYDDSPASPWDRLRERSRDPANNAIKEKLPARYRDIVERYNAAANGDDEK